MKKSKQIIWGLALILVAVLVILTQVKPSLFKGFSIWTVIVLGAMLAFFIKGIIDRKFALIFAPLAISYYVIQDADFAKNLKLPSISLWILFVIAALLTVGFSIIFKGNKKGFNMNSSANKTVIIDGENVSNSQHTLDGIVNIDCNFGAITRYVDSPDFRELNADCNFGNINIYLSNATLASAQCTVNLDSNFGNIRLYVPKEWQVVLNPDSSFGSIDYHKSVEAPAGAPIVYVNAEATFGHVDIYQM